ncbi:MAG: (d)CMP kinase [Pseudomonadaceae bacterium]|nr:(d)CMP kinase [Pseudomonadaceae bacterium]
MTQTRTLPSGLSCTLDDSADVARNPLAGVAIAIDGVYASGKGTLAITLARLYRMKYLDTGTLYRAVAWKVMDGGHTPSDRTAAAEAARGLNFDFRHVGNNKFAVMVDGKDVTEAIRTPEVAQQSSVVAAQTEVRAALLDFQKSYAAKWQPLVGVVMDGRDVGARIIPEAQVKLFLTGDVEIRARRRWLDYVALGKEKPLEAVVQELLARDLRDEVNTIQTPDALVVNTSRLDALEVLAAAEELIQAKLGGVPRAAVGG